MRGRKGQGKNEVELCNRKNGKRKEGRRRRRVVVVEQWRKKESERVFFPSLFTLFCSLSSEQTSLPRFYTPAFLHPTHPLRTHEEDVVPLLCVLKEEPLDRSSTADRRREREKKFT